MRYTEFHKIPIFSNGKSIDELVRSGVIITPHPTEITSENFPFKFERAFADILVLVPLSTHVGETVDGVLEELDLDHPEPIHAVRLVENFNNVPTGHPCIGRNIFLFLKNPYVPKHIRIGIERSPGFPCCFVSHWLSEKKRPELALWQAEREFDIDPKNDGRSDFIAGVTKNMRVVAD